MPTYWTASQLQHAQQRCSGPGAGLPHMSSLEFIDHPVHIISGCTQVTYLQVSGVPRSSCCMGKRSIAADIQCTWAAVQLCEA